jgi:hypothetical protein
VIPAAPPVESLLSGRRPMGRPSPLVDEEGRAPIPYETDRLTAREGHLERRGAFARRSGPERPRVNWTLVACWTAALVVGAATWAGIAFAILALVR